MILWFYGAGAVIAALLISGVAVLLLRKWIKRTRTNSALDVPLRAVGVFLIAIGIVPALYVAAAWKPIFAECSLERVAKNGTVIVRAIEEFEHTRGRAPSTLAELIPEFLPALPPTGCPAQSEWHYWPCDYAPPHAWGLRVSISGPTMFDYAEIHYAVDRGHENCDITGNGYETTRSADGWTYCMQR